MYHQAYLELYPYASITRTYSDLSNIARYGWYYVGIAFLLVLLCCLAFLVIDSRKKLVNHRGEQEVVLAIAPAIFVLVAIAALLYLLF